MRNALITVLAVVTASVAIASPASAVEIRKESGFMVTPAMMKAIDTIVAQRMHMMGRHRRGH